MPVQSERPPQARKNFDKADLNSDGIISITEHRAFLQRGVAAAPAPGKKKGGPPALPAEVVKSADIDYTGDGDSRQMLELYLPTS